MSNPNKAAMAEPQGSHPLRGVLSSGPPGPPQPVFPPAGFNPPLNGHDSRADQATGAAMAPAMTQTMTSGGHLHKPSAGSVSLFSSASLPPYKSWGAFQPGATLWPPPAPATPSLPPQQHRRQPSPQPQPQAQPQPMALRPLTPPSLFSVTPHTPARGFPLYPSSYYRDNAARGNGGTAGGPVPGPFHNLFASSTPPTVSGGGLAPPPPGLEGAEGS
mmetsp:Transcript_28296/g.81516  ORF Transcript_28296/g.81516 Transcript_28296/m.81516 type:complete len:217 (-) Transcript_28296:497-1147(-)